MTRLEAGTVLSNCVGTADTLSDTADLLYRRVSLYRIQLLYRALYRFRYSRALSTRAVKCTAKICCIGPIYGVGYSNMMYRKKAFKVDNLQRSIVPVSLCHVSVLTCIRQFVQVLEHTYDTS